MHRQLSCSSPKRNRHRMNWSWVPARTLSCWVARIGYWVGLWPWFRFVWLLLSGSGASADAIAAAGWWNDQCSGGVTGDGLIGDGGEQGVSGFAGVVTSCYEAV